VRDGAIEQVLPASQALTAFRDYEHVELAGHVLIPGLVNAHVQAATSLVRGLPRARKAAAERALSADFVRDGTALACAEMLRGGITCFQDRYYFPEAALDAVMDAGIRAAFGLFVADAPTTYASDPADYLRKGLATRDRHGEHGLVSFSFAPHGVADSIYKQVATLAAELDLPVQVLIQSAGEVERLGRLGLLTPGLMSVHAVRPRPDEIQLLARHGCSVALCPSSGVQDASIDSMLKSGINVALAAGEDRLDLFAEMRMAAGSPHEVLQAATVGGARALGLGAQIGSIEPGKRADLVALEVRGPCYEAVSHVVRIAGREDVAHVWVDGELRVRDGALENPASRLDTRWQLWQNSFEGHADS
jgi:5-methylthioadenosine/S-adenosylhomocysteine deaminase